MGKVITHLLTLVVTIILLPASLAQEAAVLEPVIVTGHPLSADGLSQPLDVLEGEALSDALSSNIGETLGRRPGINTTSFGKAAGRPVIHGLGGPRVRVMENRMDTLDVSVTSSDHAVTIEPFIARHIEVLKGSAALLYGSGAIGGVVNVHTDRIPHQVPEQPEGGVEIRYGSNRNDVTAVAKLNAGHGKLAVHADGTYKRGNEYTIPGFPESGILLASEGESAYMGGPTTLQGSQYRSGSGAFGASWIEEFGFVGLSVSGLSALYGLPGGHAHEGEAETGTASLDLRQVRGDFAMQIKNSSGLFKLLDLRAGYNDYRHSEIEPDGAIATIFSNRAWEFRAEALYEKAQTHGVLGVQHTGRQFSAIGEEAFIAPVNTYETGLFWAGQQALGGVDLEAGLRLGQVGIRPSGGNKRDFFIYAASIGAVTQMFEPLQLAVNLDHSSRAPVAEELYSNGPHLATQSYEIGDPGLANESATNVSATLRYEGERIEAFFTGYGIWFSNFIFSQATGKTQSESGLPEFQYQQDKAVFGGFDAEICMHVVKQKYKGAQLRMSLEHVHAVRVSGEALPRIPALRFGIGAQAEWNGFSFAIDYLYAAPQDRTAPEELPTARYDDLRASIGYSYRRGPFGDLYLFVRGRNLLNSEQRLHTSFVKDTVPLPGNSVEAGARLIF